MASYDNLHAFIWRDLKNGPVALISRGAAALPHGRSVVAVVRELLSDEIRCHFVPKTSRLAVEQDRVIVVGLLDELPEDAHRLVRAAGYPGRFDFVRRDGVIGIRDTSAPAEDAIVAAEQQHLGLVFRGVSSDLASRQTLLVTGTTPIGVYAAAVWATHLAHARLAGPGTFPASPIEAVVTTAAVRTRDVAFSNLDTLRLACGEMDYDQTAHEWARAARFTPVRVELDGGTVKALLVGDTRIVGSGDLARLLWLLIQRTVKGLWTTIPDAQRGLDPAENLKRYKTMEARLSDLRALSPDLEFIETRSGSESEKPAYRLRANIRFVEVGHAAEEER